MAATVDLTTTVTRVRLTGTWYLEPTPPARSRLDTPLQSYLTSLPKEERWPFTDCIIPDDDGRELATAIQEGKLWICADGSYKEQAQLGTTAFQLVSRISDSRWIGRFRTPGIRKFQSAYRSEAAGLCAGLHAVAIIVKKYSITAGIIRIGCDSDSALKNTFKEAPPLPTFPQYDLLRISRYWMEQLQGVQCIPTFVQGHADDLGSPLTFMEQLNVECDALAKAKLHSLLSHPIPPYDPPLAHSGPCLLMDGWRISSNVSTELYEFIHAEATMTYWEQKRDDFPPAVHWMVDWDAAEQAVNSLSTAKRIWLAKHVTEYCAVGIVMKLRGARIHSECPRCGIPDETVTHVLKCKESQATTIWKAQMDGIHSWMIKRTTDPTIIRSILAGLNSWREGGCILASYPPGCAPAILAQNFIGWENFLHGRVSLEWGDVQGRYYQLLGMRRTGKRWVSSLLLKLWHVSWTMWDHRNTVLHHNDQHVVLGSLELNSRIGEE
jgi:hypothetical protein